MPWREQYAIEKAEAKTPSSTKQAERQTTTTSQILAILSAIVL
jgi:hypothetical protein